MTATTTRPPGPVRDVPSAGPSTVLHRATPIILAVSTGLVTGGLLAAGGSLLLLPVVLVVLLVGIWAAPRRPLLLPLLALASAATPPLVAVPFLVVVGGKSLFLSDLLLPLAALVALRRGSRIGRLDLLAWAYTAVMAFQAAVGVVRKQPFEAFTQDLRGPVYLICGYFIASRLLRAGTIATVVRVAGLILWYTAGLMVVTILTGAEILSGRTEAVRAYDAVQTQEFDATRFIVNSKGLAFMVLVAALAVLMSRRSTERHRWVAGLLGLPAFTITFLGYARATTLALGLCVLVLVLLARRLQLSGPRVGGALLVLVGMLAALALTGSGALLNDPQGNALARQVAGFEERVVGGLSEDGVDSPGNQYRLLENRYALQTAATNPLFGQGIGAAYHPTFVRDSQLQAFKTNPEFGSRFIHNGWLWYLVKTGAVGLVVALALLLVPVLRTVWWRDRLPEISAVDVGIAVSILGLMVIHAFEPDLHRVGTAPVVGAALGYLSLRATASAPSRYVNRWVGQR